MKKNVFSLAILLLILINSGAGEIVHVVTTDSGSTNWAEPQLTSDVTFPPIVLSLGETLLFQWNGTEQTVNLVSDPTVFATCAIDTITSTPLANVTSCASANYQTDQTLPFDVSENLENCVTWTPSTNGTFYFAGTSAQCLNGSKVLVTVVFNETVQPTNQTELFGELYILVWWASNLPSSNFLSTPDPFVELVIDGVVWEQTRTRTSTNNPVYNEDWHINTLGSYGAIALVVMDADRVSSADELGRVPISLPELVDGAIINGVFNLDKGGQLAFYAKYTPAATLYASLEVPNVFFMARQGCRITQFQDAHTDGIPVTNVTRSPDWQTPPPGDWMKSYANPNRSYEQAANVDNLSLVPQTIYTPENCWEQIYTAIFEAKKFVYITGWSVWVNMSLLRRRPIDGAMLSVGELLKLKADQGVRVLVMIWNEKTSFTSPILSFPDGFAHTHDTETQAYFDGTNVTCRSALRDGGQKFSPELARLLGVDITQGFIWTHHQKSVIVDAEPLVGGSGQPASSSSSNTTRRRIIAFVGGLDLTSGRWDTPNHTLYRSLQSEHKYDFYNKITQGDVATQTYGPREPWEDIHSKMEGPIARDVMVNFEQRWNKQFSSDSGLLVNRSNETSFISPTEEQVYGPNHPHSWTVQLFRSIDEDIATDIGGVDDSIQQAYVHHIRRADRFIFIENQYFMGSSQYWGPEGEQVDCHNLIPIEIARKIEQKIYAGQRFAAYIIIPLFPEGDPTSATVQELLHWQFESISMMYRRVAEALSETGSAGHPTDYLNFYCLGNRESLKGSQQQANAPPPTGEQAVINATRRGMIYVHSKMMIVDDEVVLIGSANINERSMNGARDSEIAIAAFQPWQTKTHYSNGQLPRGHVHAFRMSLWKEHTFVQEDVFLRPDSIDCVRRINAIAQNTLDAFLVNYTTPDEIPDLPAHLLRYPYVVNSNGTLSALFPSFPDTTASILGKQQTILPNLMTL